MNNLSNKIGYWSSMFLIFAFIVWTISFIGIALTSPLFYWTNISDYIAYTSANNHFFQNLAMFFMLLFGPAYILLINGFYDYTTDNHKVLIRISIIFGLAFAILSSLHYFVQLSSVRLNIANGNYSGLEYFVQANPLSVMTSIDMLGWTFFLGLSSLFIIPIFKKDKLSRVIKFAFILNAISCFLAFTGYLFQIDLLTFVCVNLGIGGAILIISIASSKLYKNNLNS